MGACRLRCADNGGIVPLDRHAGNVLGHRTVEQVDTLRNIPKLGADDFRRPMLQRGPIDLYGALRRTPHADQRVQVRFCRNRSAR